jgi:hypothetical protein
MKTYDRTRFKQIMIGFDFYEALKYKDLGNRIVQ